MPPWRATYARCVPSGERATAGPLSRPANCWPGGRFIIVRVTDCGGGGFRFQVAKLAITAPKNNAPRPRIIDRGPRDGMLFPGAAGIDVTCELPPAIHFNSRHKSPAACHRSSGTFARHVFTTRSSCGGVIGCSEDIGGGSVSRIFAV